MPAYVALLRGINVGGRTLKMDQLREIATGCGFGDVSTYIQSGNVLFKSRAGAARVAETLHDAILEHAAMDSRVVVRSLVEMDALIAANPWPDRVADPTKVSVVFLYPEAVPTLDAVDPASYAPDEVALVGANAYLSTPKSFGTSNLKDPVLRKLGVHQGTIRNWRSTVSLRDLLAAMG